MALLYIFSFMRNNNISLKYNKYHFYRAQKSRRQSLEEQTEAEASKGQQFEYVIINIPQPLLARVFDLQECFEHKQNSNLLTKLLFLLSITENAGLKTSKTHGMSPHTYSFLAVKSEKMITT